MTGPRATVAHVIDGPMARGAQTYLDALQRQLDGGPDRHVIVTLFDGVSDHSRIDLGVRSSVRRRLGLDPLAVRRLRSTTRRLDPDVVVAHGGESLKYVVAARPAGRIVYYKIGTSQGAIRWPLQWAYYRSLARRIDVVAAVSEDILAEAGELLGTPPDRLVSIPNGRDPGQFAPGPDTAARSPARLAFVGHLVEAKRPGLFLDVVERLHGRGVPVEAFMVGDGPLAPLLEPRADRLGVRLLGRRDDVASLLAGSDVFVFPSEVKGEGLPGVLIEAAMSGLPIVATAVPGARDVVEDEVSGFVVAVDDLEALVEAITRLALDPELRVAMGAAGRERATARFGFATSAARWQELIDGLVRRQPVPARAEP
jgi:glycosyltransferase involved in cell wall biosynthesis